MASIWNFTNQKQTDAISVKHIETIQTKRKKPLKITDCTLRELFVIPTKEQRDADRNCIDEEQAVLCIDLEML